jgi:hypothetical protein
MTRKVWMLIGLAVLLGGLSLYLNKDWFGRPPIHIYDRSRPARGFLARRGRAEDSLINPLVLGFDRLLKLTSVKVIPLSELATNKYPHPVWELISESNSVPIKTFSYGQSIRGMHPKVKGAQPDPLQPKVPYRLFIEAGPLKAEHDFAPQPRAQ